MKRTRSPKHEHLNNANLHHQITVAQQTGRIPDSLALALVELARRLGRRGNFNGYSYRDEMEAHAIMMMIRAIPLFDLTRTNPHAYMTTIAWNAFLYVIKREKVQHDIRDDLLEDAGMTPSMSRQVARSLAI